MIPIDDATLADELRMMLRYSMRMDESVIKQVQTGDLQFLLNLLTHEVSHRIARSKANG